MSQGRGFDLPWTIAGKTLAPCHSAPDSFALIVHCLPRTLETVDACSSHLQNQVVRYSPYEYMRTLAGGRRRRKRESVGAARVACWLNGERERERERERESTRRPLLQLKLA